MWRLDSPLPTIDNICGKSEVSPGKCHQKVFSLHAYRPGAWQCHLFEVSDKTWSLLCSNHSNGDQREMFSGPYGDHGVWSLIWGLSFGCAQPLNTHLRHDRITVGVIGGR